MSLLYHSEATPSRAKEFFTLSRTIYLDKRRDVDVIRTLQRMQRARGRSVVVKHRTLADRLGCSESTVRRALDRLEAAGHIKRDHMARERGGVLCVYWVRVDVIYRRASIFRRARAKSEQLVGNRKRLCDAPYEPQDVPRGRPIQSNKRYRRARRVDPKMLKGLMTVAQSVGVDDRQRGWLKGAALRYGVKEAWNALIIAAKDGYSTEKLVHVTWGVLKNQYPEGVRT